MKRIIFGNFHKGMSPSKYDQDRFPDMVNVDISTEVGTARCNLSLTKESGTTITEPVIRCITKSGSIYWFGKTTGKIWYRSTGSVYSTITANTHTGHKDAQFFDNWVYYCTGSYIGRFHADGEANRDDSYKTFKNGGSTHAMAIINKQLFIGDDKSLAVIDTHGDFDEERILLQAHQIITLLKPYGYDLLIFTKVDSNVLEAGVYRYDTASISWSSEDYIDAGGMNIAIPSDTTDEVFVIAGNNGDIYRFNGVKLEYFSTIPGMTVATGNQLNTTYKRKSLFASGGTIYGIIVPAAGMIPAITKEYVCSAGSSSTIHSILGTGSTLLVAWQNGTTYGIDKLSTDYATATIDTPIYMGGIQNVHVGFESLPTGTSIGISTKEDNGTWTDRDVVVDYANNIVKLKNRCSNKRTIQARITLTPSGTSTPVIQFIEFIPNGL